MKTIYNFISYISSLLFLKEYTFNEEKKQNLKKRFPYLLAIWITFAIPLIFPIPNILGDIPEIIRIQATLLYLLAFSVYHWFLMIYISKFAPKHIAYFILLIPISVALAWNLILWNKPTYNGAMDGFANLMTVQMQILIIVILPTFLFALRMVKFENRFKGIYLLLIVLYSGFMGVEQCMGKEGYLADGNGNIFVFLIILLLAVAIYLFKFSTKNTFIKQ